MARRRTRSKSIKSATPDRVVELDAVEQLLVRARRLRGRGDDRGALVLMRQACNLDEWRARSFTLLGSLCSELGRCDEALRALEQARWLRVRAGEAARASVVERLVSDLASRAA